ncbi:MAG: aminoglycoside phosphotransferase family protein [Planctomyces sp.]|nr:aminoglycoside phosphotransferase family protein [Planctomyces sp.]
MSLISQCNSSENNSVKAANLDLIRRDDQLPGLGSILKPETLQHLFEQLTNGADVTDVQLNYLRYKPHRRCVALFDARRGDSSETFVATAMQQESWGNWKRKPPVPSQETNCLAIDDSFIRIERFPFDRQLRSLSKLFDSSSQRRFLTRVLPSACEENSAPESHYELHRLAYKPSRRFVIRVATPGKAMHTVKLHSSATYSSAAERTEVLRQLLPDRVSRSHLCPRYRAITTDWVPGDNLIDLLQSQSNSLLPEIFHETGRQLSLLHSTSLKTDRCLPRISMSDISADIDSLSNDLEFLYPALAQVVKSIAARIQSRLPTDCRIALIHGDFYARQVIVNNSSVHFIDFDELSTGCPYIDIGNFVAKLHWNAVRRQVPQNAVDVAVEGFLRGCRQEQDWDEQQYQCFLAVGLMKTIPHTFRQALENWPEKFSTLLELAEKCLLESEPSGKMMHAAQYLQSDQQPGPLKVDAFQLVEEVRAALKHAATQLDPILKDKHLSNAVSLRHKPGRRQLLELCFTEGTRAQQQKQSTETGLPAGVLGKVRFKGLDRRTPELHNALNRSPLQNSRHLRIPRTLGIVPALQMWIQERIDATQVTPDQRTPLVVHSRVAQALREFHSSGVVVEREHTVDDELSVLNQRLSEFRRLNPEWEAATLKILENCSALAGTLRTAKGVLIHRDFYFDQVLYDARQISMLDLDLAAMGSPELDAGNYIAHLMEYGLRRTDAAEYCRHAALVFQDCFLEANPDTTEDRLNAWTLLGLARHIWLSTQFPDRWHTTEPLIRLLLNKQSD